MPVGRRLRLRRERSGVAMRLKPERIEQLAKVVVKSLGEVKELSFTEGVDKVEALVRGVITEDMQEEEAIEEEARRMLDMHRDAIEMRGVAYDGLLRKAKAKVAQERKFVL